MGESGTGRWYSAATKHYRQKAITTTTLTIATHLPREKRYLIVDGDQSRIWYGEHKLQT